MLERETWRAAMEALARWPSGSFRVVTVVKPDGRSVNYYEWDTEDRAAARAPSTRDV